MRGGDLGGSNGALYERWNPNSPMYSPEISQTMTLTSFGKIKRNINLCNNDTGKSRDQEFYVPTYKFDLPYNSLVANTNAISAKVDENLVIYGSSWPHCGYGEAESGICGRLSQNNKFAKVGQTVLCIDAGIFLICAYMHRHKLCNHKKHGCSAAGLYKLYIIQCALLEMVRGSMSINRKMFHENPMTRVDNYFVTEDVLDWGGN